jgi:Tol biopolymer transport system component
VYVTSNVSKKSAVLRVDLTGAATILWNTDSEGLAGAVAPSPDGKYIAFSVTSTRESNAWYIERF